MQTPTLQSRLAERLSTGVLIQGEQHSFHHHAVRALLNDADVVPMASFPELTLKLAESPERLGLMAIENSVAGALLTNYMLLEEQHLTILGETYLRISHCVMAMPNTTLADLKTIESHPMALAQCRGFFRSNPTIRPIETFDTAGSARIVSEAKDASRAAIAPVWCAEAYGLDVLAKAVEDNPHNWTRFVLVAHADSPLGGTKTSIAFSVKHRSGSLAEVLGVLAKEGVSLTKIQSLPLVGKPWEYRFFVDFVHPYCDAPTALLHALDVHTNDLIHLGTYDEGQHNEP
ncbi:MAG: prephenate dehydratase [Saprospiraceae bacterium]